MNIQQCQHDVDPINTAMRWAACTGVKKDISGVLLLILFLYSHAIAMGIIIPLPNSMALRKQWRIPPFSLYISMWLKTVSHQWFRDSASITFPW